MKVNPVILIVMDGFGMRKDTNMNAVAAAKKPNFDSFWKKYPHTLLHASGTAVGLPTGLMGNSEVGHLHLGLGRIEDQELVRINKAISDRSFFKNKELLEAMDRVKKNRSSLHLLGLVSDGGVHSHINHLFALLKMAKYNGVRDVFVHAFLDGRDTPPKSAKKYLASLHNFMQKNRIGKIASLSGRYFSMDRDNRWGREHKAYDAMVNGFGMYSSSWQNALDAAYKRGESDEFVQPTIIKSQDGKTNLVNGKDSLVFFNFRSDRARELTRAFVAGEFNQFKRKKLLDIHFVTLVQYCKDIQTPVAFPPVELKDNLGETLSKKKIPQFRVAETEKYAHVTYFFNSLKEGPYPGEERVIVPSPHVPTYDLTPEMSAYQIVKEASRRIQKKKFKFILMNFANPDMVGHTGDFKATVEAVEATDTAIGNIVPLGISAGYDIIITADHGNAEDMSGKFKTSHTTNKVPCIIITKKPVTIKQDPKNSIANIAPTVLSLMGIVKPKEMIQSLF